MACSLLSLLAFLYLFLLLPCVPSISFVVFCSFFPPYKNTGAKAPMYSYLCVWFRLCRNAHFNNGDWARFSGCQHDFSSVFAGNIHEPSWIKYKCHVLVYSELKSHVVYSCIAVSGFNSYGGFRSTAQKMNYRMQVFKACIYLYSIAVCNSLIWVPVSCAMIPKPCSENRKTLFHAP